MPKQIFGAVMAAYMVLAVGSSLNARVVSASLPVSSVAAVSVAANLHGDLDGNSTVTVSDLMLLRRHLNDRTNNPLTSLQSEKADINEDGSVDAFDVYLIRNLIVGNISQSESDRTGLSGDVNGDSLVNVQDVVLIQRFSTNQSVPTGVQAVRADADMSGTIDSVDVSLVLARSVNTLQKLPAVMGDLNGDYNVNVADLVLANRSVSGLATLSSSQNFLANVYGDTAGKINSKDIDVLRKYIVRTINKLPVTVGDINKDGRVTVSDSVMLQRFINNMDVPSEDQKMSADVNIDGVLNAEDGTILRNFIVGNITALPSVTSAERPGSGTGQADPGVTITTLNGGETLVVGNMYSIRWQTSNLGTTALGQVQLWSASNNMLVYTIVEGIQLAGDSTHEQIVGWTIPSSVQPGSYKIRIICSKENEVISERTCEDMSNQSFSIVAPTNNTTPAPAPSDNTTPAPTPTQTQAPAPTDNPTPSAGGGGRTAIIAFYDRATYRLIPNSTISLYLDPATLIGTQFAAFGSATFYNLGNGWYTARGSATGYNDGAQRFIVSDLSPNPIRVNIFTTRGSSTPGRLNVSVQPTPVAHDISAGATQEHFANYQFDTTGSSEDVRLNSANLRMTFNGPGGGSANDLSNCKLYDGATIVSNVVHPTGINSPANFLFTFSPAQVVVRNTQKIYALKCDVGAAVHSGSTYSWGIASGNNVNAVGVTSGSDIPETIAPSAGQTMTVQSAGRISISTDASSPAYSIVPAGRQNVSSGVYKFRAVNEDMYLRQLGVRLTSGAVSSVASVTVWDGPDLIGRGYFTGTNPSVAVPLTRDVLLVRDIDRTLSIKVDLAQIGAGQPGVEGDLIKVDYDTTIPTNTYGVGRSSGTTIYASGSTAVMGIRMFKTNPYFLLDSLPTFGMSDGRLMRFQVRAMSEGSLGTDKYTLFITPMNVTVNNVNIIAFSDPTYSTPVNDCASGGQMMASSQSLGAGGMVEVYCQTSSGGRSTLQIPAGTTRYFEVRGMVSGAGPTSVITTTLAGDSQYPAVPMMGTEAQIDADINDNYIWSPNANGVSTQTTSDWTNGYAVPNLPASGLSVTRMN